ncbi:MAG: DUF2179 domain-containing protein [Phycisphaerales bacterium]|jgi:uncharacterized protein YebE (UPF0316 family)
MSFYDTQVFTMIVLPLLIFLSRVCDVTIGTLRLVSVSRGYKALAPLFGFVEVLIWIIVIGKVMENLNNWLCYVAYAGGFATGNYVGICIEGKLAMGISVVRIFTKMDASGLVKSLREHGYGATIIDAHGESGNVNIIYSMVNRSDLENVERLIKKFNPKAFYSVDDVRFARAGIFRPRKGFFQRSPLKLPKLYRKGK